MTRKARSLTDEDVYARHRRGGLRAAGARPSTRRCRTTTCSARCIPPHDLAGAEERLRDFLIGRFGGPPRYIEQPRAPASAHAPRAVCDRQAARNRWVVLMDRALDEARLPDDVTSLLREFFHATATFMINR